MRKSFLLVILFLSFRCMLTAQNGISYQAIARNNAGAILSNQAISVKFEIRQGSLSGTSVFTETHPVTTNSFGLFTLSIGSVSANQFQAINWANFPFFMEVSIDPAGGTSFTSVGNQQLMSVPYALYAKTAGNAGITPTISINSPNTVSSSAGSYTINVPASTTYSAGTGIAISGAVISNTATAATPTITGTGATSVTSSGNTFTVNTPASPTYSAGTGISISGGVISNTATAATPTLTGTGATSITSSGNTFTVNTPAAGVTYTAGTNQLSVTQGTAVSTVTLSTGSVNGTGTAGIVPMWGSVSTLTNSPINVSITTGGVIIGPSLAGSGSPAQSLQVHGPSSGSTYAAHFLQGINPNTGIGISTQPIGGHAIGTLNTQDLGFFTGNTNVVGNYPLVLKTTTGRVGIGNTNPAYLLDVNGGVNTSQFYNLNGLASAPFTSNGGEGKLYFNSTLNKLMMSENGGAWVPVANTLWTRGSGILYNTTLTDNVGIGTNIPSNTLDVLSNANVSALRAKNTGTGNGIEGGANTATSAGILGYNDGTGPGIAGSKSLTAASGNAGRFEIFNAANASNALVATTPGGGAAVHAINTSVGATAANLSVLLEDGHLKARFNTPVTNTDISMGSNTLGTISISAVGGADQSNDVRGVIIFNGSYVIPAGTNASTYVTVAFKKKYKNAPVIVLTPTFAPGLSDNVIVTTQLVNTGVTDFTFKLSVNYVGTGVSFSVSQFNVSYMVME